MDNHQPNCSIRLLGPARKHLVDPGRSCCSTPTALPGSLTTRLKGGWLTDGGPPRGAVQALESSLSVSQLDTRLSRPLGAPTVFGSLRRSFWQVSLFSPHWGSIAQRKKQPPLLEVIEVLCICDGRPLSREPFCFVREAIVSTVSTS